MTQELQRLGRQHAEKLSSDHAEQQRQYEAKVLSLQRTLEQERQQWQQTQSTLQQQLKELSIQNASTESSLQQAQLDLHASQASCQALNEAKESLLEHQKKSSQDQRMIQDRLQHDTAAQVARHEKTLAEKDTLLAQMREQHAATLQDYKDKLASRQADMQQLEQTLETIQQETYLAKEERADIQHRFDRESKAWSRRESSLSHQVEREKEARVRLENEFTLIQQQGGDKEQQQRHLLETLGQEKERYAKALEKSKQEVSQLAQTVREIRGENQRLEEENTMISLQLNDLKSMLEVGDFSKNIEETRLTGFGIDYLS